MSLSSKTLGIGIIIGLIIGLTIGYVFIPKGVDTIELELQISDLEDQVNILQKQISANDDMIASLESQVSQLQSKIEELKPPQPPSPSNGNWNLVWEFKIDHIISARAC